MKQAGPANKKGLTEEQFLSSYDAGRYERPSLSVDMLVFTIRDEASANYRKLPEKALQILLIRRGEHPFIGQWALPGGFVKATEGLEHAARRELKEETGIENIYMEQLYSWGDIDRDPRTRVVSVSYMSLVDSAKLDLQASDDADDARWFTVRCRLFQEQTTHNERGHITQQWFRLTFANEEEQLTSIVKLTKTMEGRTLYTQREVLESGGLAFDHAKIIAYGIERLRNKIEYTDIAFHLMPELFTLTQLQQVYEIILDTELLKANFRRKISDRVLETNQFTRDAGHRPSKLFRYHPGT